MIFLECPRSGVLILHHYGNVTESGLAGLMEGFGIQISAGSISNLLKAEHDWSVEDVLYKSKKHVEIIATVGIFPLSN